ncbi:retrovirus-related pol polyprotein from transposon TNT 1-94 [Tanacetum coccineum]
MTGDPITTENIIETFMAPFAWNDNFAAITGYGDYIQGNITICHVYYVEGLGHNLFSVGQFFDGDLDLLFHETPEIIKKFIAQAQLNYKAKVCKIRTDNGTEFKNATLKAHYEKLGIMQQFSTARTPQQNGVVERRNRTLVEAARKMKPKADIGVFIGYSKTSRGFQIYNRRTKKIMETIHVKFNELTAMASEHDCLEPEVQRFINHNSLAKTINTPSKEDLDNLFGPMYEEYFEKKFSDTPINPAAQPTQIHEDSPSTSSIIIDEHEAPPIVTTFDE